MIAGLMLRIAQISLISSILIILLLLLIPVLQKRYRAKWRYFAWLLISVRLLIPFNPSFEQSPVKIEVPERTAPITYQPIDNLPQLEIVPAIIETNDLPEADMKIPASRGWDVSLLQIISSIWLAGVSVFLLFQLGSYWVFLWTLKRSGYKEVPERIIESLCRLNVEMGICKPLKVLISNVVDVPVLIGVFHPRIFIPHANYTDEEIGFILSHELTHYRRKDMWYKLILLLANAIHWFNPLVYMMTARAAKDVELACDDDVAKNLSEDARMSYGETILAALPRKRRLMFMFSTQFGSTKKNIKSRLHNLFDRTTKSKGMAALCALMLCTVVLSGMVSVSAAASSGEPQKDYDQYLFLAKSVEAGKVVCVGEIDLEAGITYHGSASVKSGGGLFVGFSTSPDISSISDAKANWQFQYTNTGKNLSQLSLRSGEKAHYYIYAGSKTTKLISVTVVINVPAKLTPEKPNMEPVDKQAPDKNGQIDNDESQNLGSSAAAFSDMPWMSSLSIHANGGTWASAYGGIDGINYQEQLDEEIKWLQKTYDEHRTPFVITETLPENEINNPASLKYLYEHSDIYRSMSQMKDGVFHVTDGSYSTRFGMFLTYYQRTAVMVENSESLTIDINYTLEEGTMAVWLIDPNGKIVYQGDLVKSYQGTYTVPGSKGLWSVVTLTGDSYGGVSAITLKQERTGGLQAINTEQNTSFTVTRLGNYRLSENDRANINLSWTGDGYIIYLDTKNNYTDEEFYEMFHNGILGGEYKKGSTEKYKNEQFHFSQALKSPLKHDGFSYNDDTYYFYLVHIGDTGDLSGSISIKKNKGNDFTIWDSNAN